MQQRVIKQFSILALGAMLTLAIALGYASPASAAHATSTTGTTTYSYIFDAHLTGANQIPPVSATTSTSTINGATTTGHARVWFDMTTATSSATTTTMMWQWLQVWNGDDIVAAHLHCGLAGQNGPVVLDMYSPVASSTDVNGTLVATSSVSVSNLRATTTGCSMPITNLTELAQALKAGIIYANVHSLQYPGGVVRGQMTLTAQSSTSTSSTTPPISTTTPPIGTTTPPMHGKGLGSSISSFVHSLLNSSDSNAGGIGKAVSNFVRNIRMFR